MEGASRACGECGAVYSPEVPRCPWCSEEKPVSPAGFSPIRQPCMRCGGDLPLRGVTFHWNVGLILFRFEGSSPELMCKGCIHAEFWKATTLNLFCGWWGILSFFFTIAYLLTNTIKYLFCLRMPAQFPANKP